MPPVTRCHGAAFAALLVCSLPALAGSSTIQPTAQAASQAQAPSTPSASTASASTAPASTPAELVKQGRRLSNEGQQDQALALYQQALKSAPDLAEAHLASGIALDLKGQYATARTHLQKAIDQAKTPEETEQARRTMAISYAFDKNAKQAIALDQLVFDARIAASDFDGAAGVANELARLCLESGAIDEAQQWYTRGYDTALKAGDLSPVDRALWQFRWEHAQARVAARRGNKAEAEQHVAAAKLVMEKQPLGGQEQFVPYLTGYVAFYTGDVAGAIAALQQANQKDPFILGLLAQAHEKAGDRAQATEYYRKVLGFSMHNLNNALVRPLAREKVGAS